LSLGVYPKCRVSYHENSYAKSQELKCKPPPLSVWKPLQSFGRSEQYISIAHQCFFAAKFCHFFMKEIQKFLEKKNYTVN
jgi:hypothetical protein